MSFGYQGRILHVNLTTSRVTIEKPGDEFYRKYLGGAALNTYYLLKLIPPGADPLSHENVLAISVGVTTGAPVAGQSRVDISSKSPLTGLIGDSQAGGYFPAEMKYSGFDAFIIAGISPKPVYLWVHDGQVELKDASKIWGYDTGDTEDYIKRDLENEKIEIASIGQAGENLVKFASIMNMCNRANGRTGMGAVMGSKKLKAIAVFGSDKRNAFHIANTEKFRELVRKGHRRKGSPFETFGKFGTAGVAIIPQNDIGSLPTHNYSYGTFPEVEMLSGEKLYNEFLAGRDEGKQNILGRDTCYACPIKCKRVVEITDEHFTIDKRYGGPEYETIAMFGSNCEINDLLIISKANELCNRYGLDTISCGGTIAWMMECFENGKLTKEITEGMEIHFGEKEKLLEIIEKIAKREGFGDVLAEGSYNAAKIIGRGTDEYLVVANKQELPAHMPHVKRGLGVNYAVNDYGADHNTVGYDAGYELRADGTSPPSQALEILGLKNPTKPRSLGSEKIKYIHTTQKYHSMLDCLCWCLFVSGSSRGLFNPNELTQIVQSVTGWDITLDELMQVGERKINMMRLFNIREGHTKEQDKLPPKIFQPLGGRYSDGYEFAEKELLDAINELFHLRDWDLETGIPQKNKISELGLEWIVQ